MATIPVPPPLPPKSSFKPPDPNANTGDNTQLPDPEVQVQVETLWQSVRTDYKSGIYCLTPAHPVLQSGPTCGLVALAMAMDSLGLQCSVCSLLSEAQKRGFTRHGEMMSVHSMKCLCEQLYPAVTATITSGLRKNISRLLDHLACGWPVILPYDCDANHAPAVRNGKRAHWATILGFAMLSHDPNADRKQPVHYVTPVSSDQLSHIQSCCSTHNLFLYAQQGKSKFMQLWNFDDLCDSNENLLQVSDKLNSISHVLPEGGDLSESLADQFILIEPHHSDCPADQKGK